MTRRVLLHVGAPKTGTSFVQDILFTHRETLRERGILYPADRHDSHFLAALDLMELPWGGLEREAGGAWDRLVAEIREWPGTAIISHEILGTASRVQVARALESLGAHEGTEVHLVYSSRDLVRQIPAEWQENVKHRRLVTYGEFLDQIRDPDRTSTLASWFWGVQEVPEILDRWGGELPPEQVHVVTVPHPGAPRDLLWERFMGVLGIEPTSLAEGTDRANPSLGVPETALVRRLNERLRDVVPNERYRQFVREYLVHQTLSRGQTSARLSVPPDVFVWADELSRSWRDHLSARGYDVVGDLDELVPAAPLPWVDPDHPDPTEVAEVGLKGLDAMVREAARLRDVEIELHEVIGNLQEGIARFERRPAERVKRRLVREAETNPVAKAGLGAYRALLGKNSR